MLPRFDGGFGGFGGGGFGGRNVAWGLERSLMPRNRIDYGFVQGEPGFGGYFGDMARTSFAQSGGRFINSGIGHFGQRATGGLFAFIDRIFDGGRDDDYGYQQHPGYGRGGYIPQPRGFGSLTGRSSSYTRGGMAGYEDLQTFEEFVDAREASAARQIVKLKDEFDGLEDLEADKKKKSEIEAKVAKLEDTPNERNLLIQYLNYSNLL
jgi:hypothetical protein